MSAKRTIELTVAWSVAVGSAAVLVRLAASGLPFGLIQGIGLIAVGVTIVTQRPGNRVGWVMLVAAATIVPFPMLQLPGFAAAVPAAVEVALNVVGSLSSLLFALSVLIYPTGRITTRAGRVIAGLLAMVALGVATFTLVGPGPLIDSGRANPLAVDAVSPVMTTTDGLGILDILWLAGMLLALAALVEMVPRWRRAAGAERLQYRWFAYGVVVVLVCIAVLLPTGFTDWALILYSLSINALPISIGIAITRHGLYEINRVVSRSVSYVIVTLLAVGVYALVVTSITWVLPDAPSLAVAAATLAAAAVFLPVLRWVRRIVDRRFDRERYDAQKVVDAFGEGLRTEVDPSTTAHDLVRAAERTLQPASVGVWTVDR